MNFSDVMREESKWTKTENGADVKNTTDSALLDMFATIGSMRSRPEDEIIKKFELAFQEDPLGAMRCLFYARDIRGGLGERRVFRVLLPYIARKHTNELKKNIDRIPEYGRWDDAYSLIDTPLESEVWELVKEILKVDKTLMEYDKPCSLLAKWLKKADASSPNTRKLGIYTAKKLGMSVYDYKRLCNRLRKHIDVVEQRMSARQWDTINYPAVPSRAMLNYRKAFARHDQERFAEYINKVSSGEQKINAATLYPYDIVGKILYGREDSKVLEAQWDNLPNYVDDDVNAVVMADVSGSMYGRPMATSIGLAMYFAERNKGAYHNLFMTFSGRPEFVEIKGNTITQKINFIKKANWGMDTDLEAALLKILDVAIENHCTQEEMPKSLIIISDMEINRCTEQEHGENFYDYVARVYEEHGYRIPNVVFWNVNSRHDVFLADKNRKGMQLVSGQSASTFKNLIGCVDKTPVEMMYAVLNSERYQAIQI
ncbi:hypothetical protein B5F53_12060 [Blautia sp. An249]|uniref:DUF2828 family protein n=1 Tax=Blautia sp. An249 TaxID=1965603 RepID=UPI000B37F193|nr:DUF2828 family protein [Blautia sp. An249]OUO77939.1 hypothetical protein B5F53_12060 [Blautia sp. An249]